MFTCGHNSPLHLRVRFISRKDIHEYNVPSKCTWNISPFALQTRVGFSSNPHSSPKLPINMFIFSEFSPFGDPKKKTHCYS